jgi:hypothetical protein
MREKIRQLGMLSPMPAEGGRDSRTHVKLFKNRRNQAVRLPRELELPGEDAIMRKEGERLIIEPGRPVRHLCIKISA